jgi:hypothetical protein
MSGPALTLEDVRAEAKSKLKGICNVYRDCDGHPSRLCQAQQYGQPLRFGGIGSGASFHNNWLALRRLTLRMRTIGEEVEVDTGCSFLGRHLSMPVMAAPVSGVDSFGGPDVIPEADFCLAVVLGCRAAGTLPWRGHTHTYSLEQSFGLDAIAAGNCGGVAIVKPIAQADIIRLFRKAEQCGATAVGVDVDGFNSFAMTAHGKPVFRKGSQDLRELVQATRLPFVAKGVMCAEDAVAAAEAGAAVVVVSNHGGRVLDHTPGTADVLPEVAAALRGGRVALVADGGVRTGYDVLKMLALGADAVLVGRDVVRAAVGGGSEGVRLNLVYLQKTLAKAMKMTGCAKLADIGAQVLAPYRADVFPA